MVAAALGLGRTWTIGGLVRAADAGEAAGSEGSLGIKAPMTLATTMIPSVSLNILRKLKRNDEKSV